MSVGDRVVARPGATIRGEAPIEGSFAIAGQKQCADGTSAPPVGPARLIFAPTRPERQDPVAAPQHGTGVHPRPRNRAHRWHYPEKSGFGRPTEREWGSPAATPQREQEKPPCEWLRRPEGVTANRKTGLQRRLRFWPTSTNALQGQDINPKQGRILTSTRWNTNVKSAEY
jgi:hypothetical protein